MRSAGRLALMMLAILAAGGAASAAAPDAPAASTAPTTPTAPPAPTPPPVLTQEFLPPIPVAVPASGSVDVQLDLEGSSVAGVTILGADATVSANIGATPLVVTDSVIGKSLSVTLHDPGSTTLRITNASASPAQVAVLASILSDRHILIATSAPWAMVDGTIAFSVLVTRPLDGDELAVQLADGSDPTGLRMPVPIAEDGPGRWTGSITFEKPGPWVLLAQVTGEQPRIAAAQLSVSAGLARLGDGFAERLVDADGDTLTDALVLSPQLLVSRAGAYHVNARLVTQDGRDVATAGQTIELSTGSHRVDLSFDGERIFGVGAPGPYRLIDVRVFDEARPSSTGPEDSRADLGATEAYEVDRFQHAPVAFDGDSFRNAPVDLDGDGSFETIRFAGTVTVAVAGTYDLGAQLLANDGSLNGQPVDYASTRLLLDAGTNDFELDFDGGAIRAAGMDGPYEIRRPALTMRSNHDISGDGPTTFTASLSASSFEAGTPDPDATPQPLRDDPGDAPP